MFPRNIPCDGNFCSSRGEFANDGEPKEKTCTVLIQERLSKFSLSSLEWFSGDGKRPRLQRDAPLSAAAPPAAIPKSQVEELKLNQRTGGVPLWNLVYPLRQKWQVRAQAPPTASVLLLLLSLLSWLLLFGSCESLSAVERLFQGAKQQRNISSIKRASLDRGQDSSAAPETSPFLIGIGHWPVRVVAQLPPAARLMKLKSTLCKMCSETSLTPVERLFFFCGSWSSGCRFRRALHPARSQNGGTKKKFSRPKMSSEKTPAAVLGPGSKFYDWVFITFIFGRCGKDEVMDFFLSIKTSALHLRDNLNFLFVWLYFQTSEGATWFSSGSEVWPQTQVRNSLVGKIHKIYFSLDLVRFSLLFFTAINQLTALCPAEHFTQLGVSRRQTYNFVNVERKH